MPKLLDHPQEMDRTHTPLEVKRRESMRLKSKQYGFYPVVKDPTTPLICDKCGLEINGESLNINGRITHYKPCV